VGPKADFSPGNIAGHLVSGTARAIAAGAARSLIDGSNFGDNVLAALPNVIGQTIGEMVAGGIVRSSQRRASPIEFGVAEGSGGPYVDIPLDNGVDISWEDALRALQSFDLKAAARLAGRLAGAAGSALWAWGEDFGASDPRTYAVGEGTGVRILSIPGDLPVVQQQYGDEWVVLQGVGVEGVLNDRGRLASYRVYTGDLADAYIGDQPRAFRDFIAQAGYVEGYDAAPRQAPLPGMSAHQNGPTVLATPGHASGPTILSTPGMESGATVISTPVLDGEFSGPFILYRGNFTGDDRVKFVNDPDWGRGRSPAAAAFEDGTAGAIYTTDGIRLAPALTFTNPNASGKGIVRWDGWEIGANDAISLIDSKTTFAAAWSRNQGSYWVAPSLSDQLNRQSQALAQNPGIRGVIEVPNAAQLSIGRGVLQQLDIQNIQVRQRQR
ncbi:MAG: hypothetical protein JNM59_01195, partial [Hyphomonadaceae bacterium]|nr:hypothetical protein [Hyphomonadaceae bacterium]